MTVYKVYFDNAIETTNIDKAADILIEQNGAKPPMYFTDRAEAQKCYDGISLNPPKHYGDLIDFSGKIFEAGYDCEEDEETLAEAFLSATEWNIIDWEINNDEN